MQVFFANIKKPVLFPSQAHRLSLLRSSATCNWITRQVSSRHMRVQQRDTLPLERTLRSGPAGGLWPQWQMLRRQTMPRLPERPRPRSPALPGGG